MSNNQTIITDTDTTTDQPLGQQLTADVETIEEQIRAFNTHWLNHKNLTAAVAAIIMALIFVGMLVPSINIVVWSMVGVLTVVFAGVMFWRGQQAKKLNDDMESAAKALKEYKRGRRKKKK